MPWSKQDYPNSMKNLGERTRNKAIEIANALLEDGYDDSRAIAIATSQAKQWAENRGYDGRSSSDSNSNGSSSDSTSNGRSSSMSSPKPRGTSHSDNSSQHVVPHEKGWAVQRDGANRPSYVFDTKSEALSKGAEIARNQKVNLVVHKQDGTIERHENYHER